MTLSVELSDDVARRLKQLSEADLTFYREGVTRYATVEAERFAGMTDFERREYEEIRIAIAESEAQYERGEYMTWEEARERMRREVAAERAQTELAG